MFENFPPALWLIPILVLVTIAGLVWLVRLLQRRAEKDLKELRLSLRGLQAERKAQEFKAQAYGGRDPEPYRSASIRLREMLSAARGRLDALERGLVALNERQTSLKSNRLRVLFGAPYLWHSLHREASLLKGELVAVQSHMLQTTRLQEELDRLAWQVAGEVRDLRRDLQTTSEFIGKLRARGVRGETFDTAVRLERQVQTAIAQAPSFYFENDEASLLQAADKTTTARVFGIVQANRPNLVDLLERARRWDADYIKTEKSVSAMRQALDALGQEQANLPSGLKFDEAEAALQQLEEIAQNLQSTASRLEVENMPLVSQEAERLSIAIVEKSRELQKARRELDLLNGLLGELSTGFHNLSMLIAELGARHIHPIQWEASLEELARLNRQANTIGTARKQRTAAEVSADLAAASSIRIHQEELGRRIQAVERDHSELKALLENPEFVQMPGWVQAARKLAAEISAYAAENWPRLDEAPNLAADLDRLAQQVELLVSGDKSSPLSELEAFSRLGKTRQLAVEYRRLAVRVENIRQRLEEIQQSETRAKATLEELQKNLGQIRLVASSNTFLAGAAMPEMDLLVRSAQEISGELDKRQRGSVEKKTRTASSLADRAEVSAARWMDLLTREVQLQLKELAQSLSQLDVIARLEDTSVARARQLLSSEAALAVSQSSNRSRHKLPDTILEFKRRSSIWQECAAAQKALENVRQLVDTHREAAFQRDQARDLVAGSGTARRRTWPPVATTLEPERRDLEILEGEWTSLRERSANAIALVAQYSGLASRYQNLVDRVHKSSSHREKEQRQMEQLEDEINDLTGPWRQMLDTYRDNPTASREIRDLLDDLREQMQNIKSDYLNSSLDYDDVLDQLKTLQRRIRFYQVALDDEHAIDSSGRITRRRQSERGGF